MKTRTVAVARIDLVPQGATYIRVGWVRHPDTGAWVSVGLGPVGSPFPTGPGPDGLLARVPANLAVPIYRWSMLPTEVTAPAVAESDPAAVQVGPEALGAPEQRETFDKA